MTGWRILLAAALALLLSASGWKPDQPQLLANPASPPGDLKKPQVTATPEPTEKTTPPQYRQLRLEFSPRLAEHELPASLDPRRVKIRIDSDTPGPAAETSRGTLAISIDFADGGEATVAGPFQLDHRPLSLDSENLTLRAEALAPFLPQPLMWQGRANYDSKRLQVDGLLSLTPELKLAHRLLVPGGLPGSEAEIRLQETKLPFTPPPFLPPLMDGLNLPEPLPELESGLLTGQAKLTGRQDGWRATGQLRLSGVDGIYQTAFFKDLDLVIPFQVEEDWLELTAVDLELWEFNPGIALGPVKARGNYRAPSSRPGRGRLEVETLEAGFLGGRLWAEPFAITPGQDDFPVNLRIEGLEMARLLAVYPIPGLTGTGLIDGHLPLRRQEGKISLTDGLLTARPPGGAISYDGKAAAALAQRHPALKLALDALSDFHYNALAAEATYLEDGTLLLDLRLEGSNPQIERGRPILLEINIEENIPQLLAGLQLTNRISDTIRQRIKERYR